VRKMNILESSRARVCFKCYDKMTVDAEQEKTDRTEVVDDVALADSRL